MYFHPPQATAQSVEFLSEISRSCSPLASEGTKSKNEENQGMLAFAFVELCIFEQMVHELKSHSIVADKMHSPLCLMCLRSAIKLSAHRLASEGHRRRVSSATTQQHSEHLVRETAHTRTHPHAIAAEHSVVTATSLVISMQSNLFPEPQATVPEIDIRRGNSYSKFRNHIESFAVVIGT